MVEHAKYDGMKLKSYEKPQEKNEGSGVFQCIYRFVFNPLQNQINNGFQRMKDMMSTPTSHSGVDEEEEEIGDSEIRDSGDTMVVFSSSRRVKKKKHAKQLSFDKGYDCLARQSSGLIKPNQQANSYPPERKKRHTHVSMGRGAWKPLCTFLMFVSKMGMCMAAGEDRSNPIIPLNLTIIVLAVLWTVYCFLVVSIRMGQCNKTPRPERSKKVFNQPQPDPFNGRAVYVSPSGSSPLQLLPGSCTVCTLGSTVVVPEQTSNSYATNVGFEQPEFPFNPHLLLPRPTTSHMSAAIAMGDPTPEIGVRNSQLLHGSSELVIGGGGSSPNPHGSSTKSQKIENPSFSRTVSLPYEDANCRSFNADAAGVASDEIVMDDTELPSENERNQRARPQANAFVGEEEYCPFDDSDSEDEG